MATRQIVQLKDVSVQPNDTWAHKITYTTAAGVPINLVPANVTASCVIKSDNGVTTHHTLTDGGAGAAYDVDGTDGAIIFYLTAAQIAAMGRGLYRVYFRFKDTAATPQTEDRALAYYTLSIRRL